MRSVFKKIGKKFSGKETPSSGSSGSLSTSASTSSLPHGSGTTTPVANASKQSPTNSNTTNAHSRSSSSPLLSPPNASGDGAMTSHDPNRLSVDASNEDDITSGMKRLSVRSQSANNVDMTNLKNSMGGSPTEPDHEGRSHFATGNSFPIPSASKADFAQQLPSLLEVPEQVIPGNDPLAPSSLSRQNLFVYKLCLCSMNFDWSAEKAQNVAEGITLTQEQRYDAHLKEKKLAQLHDLLNFITKGKPIYTDPILQEIISFISANLFRALPPRGTESTNEEDEPILDPSWAHLQVVYEFLLRLVMSTDIDLRTLKKHLTSSFILHLLELFDSEDHRERNYLKTILHRIYAKFMSLRAFIRKSINHSFLIFVYETEHHNGIAELLEILGSIINGFALPLKAEHTIFLQHVLFPLHKVHNITPFHQQLSYCVSQFVDKDPSLSSLVVRGLLNYWPLCNSAKEVSFLNELEEILELTPAEEFKVILTPLIHRLALCLQSPHFQVAERALFLWHNEYIAHLIASHRDQVWPMLKGLFASRDTNPINGQPLSISMLQQAPRHWNATVQNLMLNVWKLCIDLDAPLMERVVKHAQEKEEEEQMVRAERDAAWSQLEQLERKYNSSLHRPSGSENGISLPANSIPDRSTDVSVEQTMYT